MLLFVLECPLFLKEKYTRDQNKHARVGSTFSTRYSVHLLKRIVVIVGPLCWNFQNGIVRPH